MECAEATVDNTRTPSGKIRWTAGMEVLLIDSWQENIEQLRGARKNTHVYMEMAKSIMEAGYDVSWKDVRTKIENLTKKYRQEKNKMGPSGGAPSLWQHFESLHSFLGSFRINNMELDEMDNDNAVEYLKDALIDPESLQASNCIEGRSASTRPPAKLAKSDHKSELVEIARERLQEQRSQTDILFRMQESQQKFQSELLTILKDSNK